MIAAWVMRYSMVMFHVTTRSCEVTTANASRESMAAIKQAEQEVHGTHLSYPFVFVSGGADKKLVDFCGMIFHGSIPPIYFCQLVPYCQVRNSLLCEANSTAHPRTKK
tara:strand:- start:278 stop:601 length:324 start_codon:yes stop_codon:yes gene_type:complete